MIRFSKYIGLTGSWYASNIRSLQCSFSNCCAVNLLIYAGPWEACRQLTALEAKAVVSCMAQMGLWGVGAGGRLPTCAGFRKMLRTSHGHEMSISMRHIWVPCRPKCCQELRRQLLAQQAAKVWWDPGRASL